MPALVQVSGTGRCRPTRTLRTRGHPLSEDIVNTGLISEGPRGRDVTDGDEGGPGGVQDRCRRAMPSDASHTLSTAAVGATGTVPVNP